MTKINHTQFIELYNKGLNDTEIAKELKVSNAAVTYHRQKNKMEKNFAYKTTLSEDIFMKLYEQGFSDRKMANILGVSRHSVEYMRTKLKLGKSYKILSLSSFQRSLLIGTLLGDSHLRVDNINAWGDFAHSIVQKDYAIHKYEMLKDICSSPKEEFPFDKRTGLVYPRIHVRFLSHPYLTSIYNILYYEKKKVITKEVLSEVNEISLAYLFMDDGVKSPNGYYICTNGFDRNSVELFSAFLFDKFGIKNTIDKRNTMYIHKKSRQIFANLVEPYIIESMKYKL